MSHPRRAPVSLLISALGTIPAVSGRVFEAPLVSIDGRKPDALPALAVNYRNEPARRTSQSTRERTLTLAVVVAHRTQAEADELDGLVEDVVDALGAWDLVDTEFGVESPERGSERPFFVHALIYQRRYSTSTGGV